MNFYYFKFYTFLFLIPNYFINRSLYLCIKSYQNLLILTWFITFSVATSVHNLALTRAITCMQTTHFDRTSTHLHTIIYHYTCQVQIAITTYSFVHVFIRTCCSLNIWILHVHTHVSLSSRQMWSAREASTTRTPSTAIVLAKMKVSTFWRALYRPFPFSLFV